MDGVHPLPAYLELCRLAGQNARLPRHLPGRPRGELRAWRERVQPRLLTALHQPWRGEPRPLAVSPHRAPLTGYKVFNRTRGAALVLAALATLAATFFLFNYLIR